MSTVIKKFSTLKRVRFVTRRPRKGSRKDLKEQLDVLTSQIVRLRDQACVLCGSRLNLENSHFYARGNPELRFDLLNCHAMCSLHNQQHNNNREPYTTFMIRTYGPNAIDELNRRRLEGEKLSDSDLKDLILEYKGLLEVLKSEAI